MKNEKKTDAEEKEKNEASFNLSTFAIIILDSSLVFNCSFLFASYALVLCLHLFYAMVYHYYFLLVSLKFYACINFPLMYPAYHVKNVYFIRCSMS